MSTTDPLNLLRGAISSGQLPSLLDANDESCPLVQATKISFASTDAGTITLPITTPTRFTVRENDTSEFHTLQQLYYVYVERETGGAEYMRKAQAVVGGMRVVSIINRRLVLDYLEGKTEAPKGRVVVQGSDPAQPAFEGTSAQTAAPVTSQLAGVSTVPLATPSTQPGRPAIGVGYVKRKYEVNEADREAVKKIKAQEISLQDRNDSLRVSHGGKKNDFSALRRTINDTQIKPLRAYLTELAKSGNPAAALQASKRPMSSNAPTPTHGSVNDPSRANKKKGPPVNIIVISSSPTALISMWNVKRFLEDGVYESNEEARLRQQAEGNKRPEDIIVVYRKVQGPDGHTKTMKFLVVDNVDAMAKLASAPGTDDVWDRVLCVFTTGQTWQFKPYRWQDPRELFRHVRGVYLHFSNEKPNPAVKDWKVTTLQVDPFKRHTDRQVVTTFWHIMDNVLRR